MQYIEHFLWLLRNNMPFAISRFNDGEISAIRQDRAVVSRGDQNVDDRLSKKLWEALTHRQLRYYVGLPDEKFKEAREFAEKAIGDYGYITSAVVFHDDQWVKFLSNIEHITSYFDSIVWVGPKHHRVDNLPFKVTYHLPVSLKNAFGDYDRVKGFEVPEQSLVLLSCGPLGRVLSKEWFESHPGSTFMEIGSALDPFVQGIRRPYQKKYWSQIVPTVREW